jgi:hypothetical protein
MNLRKIYFFLFHSAFVFSAMAQNELAIDLEKDEFCSYVKLSGKNIEKLILSNDEDFQEFMYKKGFRKAELGKKNEYIAPSTKLNHARLLSKYAQTLQFTFSPIPSDLVKSFLADLNTHAKLISSNQKGNKTTLIIEFPTLSPHQHQISLEEKNDTEEYVGRTIVVKNLVVEVREVIGKR